MASLINKMCEIFKASHNIVVFISVVTLIYGQHDPNFKHNRRAIVQLFEWKFADIAQECETFLGKNSFAGVQVYNSLPTTKSKNHFTHTNLAGVTRNGKYYHSK